ncbi:bola-like protein, partial [Trichodelitschia bisporula]
RIQAAAAVQAPEPPDYLDDKERGIFLRLREALDPVALEVQDISGGCGSMYAVAITAEAFRGLPVIKQHRLVNDILKSDIKEWHGIQLRTK